MRIRFLVRVAMLGAVLGACVGTTHGQLRVATWNITQYWGGSSSDIVNALYGEYQGRALDPDLIVLQEIMSASAVGEIVDALNAEVGTGIWDADYVGSDPGYEGMTLLYRTDKLVFRGSTVISQGGGPPNPPRDTVRCKFFPRGYQLGTMTLVVYNSHMKAGTSGSDMDRRLLEAERIRDDAEGFGANAYKILGADLNIRYSSEAAYQELVESQADNTGRFFDPVNSPGTWNNNYTYRFLHSQDPVSQMDDRYDQILISENLIDGVGLDYLGNATVPFSTSTWNDANHSYRTWGNDGSTYNSALRTTGNTMVGQSIAQSIKSLASGGGHVPVYLDLQLPALVGADETLDFGQVPQGAAAELTLEVWNAGDTTLWGTGIAPLEYGLAASTGFGAPVGTFYALAGASPSTHTITMDTSATGLMSGTLTISSNSHTQSTLEIPITGEVVAPTGCPGDYDCDGDRDYFDINYMIEALGGEAQWTQHYRDQNGGVDPPCSFAHNCDPDGQGDGTTYFDINPFLDVLGGPCP